MENAHNIFFCLIAKLLIFSEKWAMKMKYPLRNPINRKLKGHLFLDYGMKNRANSVLRRFSRPAWRLPL